MQVVFDLGFFSVIHEKRNHHTLIFVILWSWLPQSKLEQSVSLKETPIVLGKFRRIPS